MGKIGNKIKGFYENHKKGCDAVFVVGGCLSGAALVIFGASKAIDYIANKHAESVLNSPEALFFSECIGELTCAQNMSQFEFVECLDVNADGTSIIKLSDCGKYGEMIVEKMAEHGVTIDDSLHGAYLLLGDKISEA